jgi:uncharacterized RDD family membrane protein YckC
MIVEPMAPPMRRRLAAMVYESILLFGVLVIAGYMFSVATEQRHALQGKTSMQAFVFLLLGAYFTYFWHRSGQTLAMKTWHIQLVKANAEPLEAWRCTARYVVAWLWFLPPLLIAHTVSELSLSQDGLVVLGWMLGYAAVARLTPGRQFMHDRFCGTRLVSTAPHPTSAPDITKTADRP